MQRVETGMRRVRIVKTGMQRRVAFFPRFGLHITINKATTIPPETRKTIEQLADDHVKVLSDMKEYLLPPPAPGGGAGGAPLPGAGAPGGAAAGIAGALDAPPNETQVRMFFYCIVCMMSVAENRRRGAKVLLSLWLVLSNLAQDIEQRSANGAFTLTDIRTLHHREKITRSGVAATRGMSVWISTRILEALRAFMASKGYQCVNPNVLRSHHEYEDYDFLTELSLVPPPTSRVVHPKLALYHFAGAAAGAAAGGAPGGAVGLPVGPGVAGGGLGVGGGVGGGLVAGAVAVVGEPAKRQRTVRNLTGLGKSAGIGGIPAGEFYAIGNDLCYAVKEWGPSHANAPRFM